MSTIKTINVQHPSSASVNIALDSAGSVGIGTASPGSALDVKGTVRLSGATSGYVGLAPAAAAGSTTYTLPSADGAATAALTTDGAGTLSWAARVNSLVAGNGITVSAATGDVTVSQDFYTGSSATITSYAIGTILFVNLTSAPPNLNNARTLYVVTSTSGTQVTDSSAGRTAVTGTWRSRGSYNPLNAITAIDFANSTSTTTSYYFAIFQRTA